MNHKNKRKIDSIRIALPALTYALSNTIAYTKNNVLIPILDVRYVAEKISRIIFLVQFVRAEYFRVLIAPPCFSKEMLKIKTFPFILF